MTNPHRGPEGRFSSRSVNNNNTAPAHSPRKEPSSTKFEPNTKKRRLNNGTSQKSSSQQVSSAQPDNQLQASRRHPPQSHELKQLVEDQNNYPLQQRHGKDGVFTPKPKSGAEDKRTLRSQDVVRPRSELASFFADYEDVVFNEAHSHGKYLVLNHKAPKDSNAEIITGALDAQTRLWMAQHPKSSSRPRRALHLPIRTLTTPKRAATRIPDIHPLSNNAFIGEDISVSSKAPKRVLFRRVNLPDPLTAGSAPTLDPLTDELYSIAHKRGERREKQSRNWDKELAMHEKGELERLLAELRGPDWLKLMGIHGVSETESRKFRDKRNIFISRAKTMLERYDAWRDRDRELKTERDRKLVRQAESSSEVTGSRVASPTSTSSRQRMSDSDHKTTSKDQAVEYWEAQQAPEEKPMESFFKKPHEREAALKGYRRGRRALAFGQPIPDLPEFREFELSSHILNSKRKREEYL